MTKSDHRIVAELFRADNQSAGEATIAPDWEPAVSWTALAAAREDGRLPGTGEGGADVAPLWATDGGEPFVDGFRVQIKDAQGHPFVCDFGLDYVDGPISDLAGRFVKEGRLTAGESYTYRLAAYPNPQDRTEGRGFGITVTNTPWTVADRSISELLEKSRVIAGERAVSGDLTVFVPQQVVDEATELALSRSEEEVGGILIGRVCRDPSSRKLFTEITAQIPAVHTRSSSTRLTFTAETWAAAESAVALRGKNETWLGWQHSHPARTWCAKCKPERRRVCPMRANFFSTTDVALHRTVFLAAYTVALVITDSESGIDVSMFGWRCGRMQSRSFRVVKD